MLSGVGTFEEFDIAELDGCGIEGDGHKLEAWDQAMCPGFGKFVSVSGIIDNPDLPIEVYDDHDLGDGTVRTPMLELAPMDYEYMQHVSVPYPGMLGLCDMGDVYEWDTMGGLWKRIKRRAKKIGRGIKKGFKKVGRGLKKGAKGFARGVKKVMTKTKFGRAIVKFGKGVKKVAFKVVRPLAKKIGTWAPRLAPLAALIPGVGPAISAGMLAGGAYAKAIDVGLGKIKKVLTVAKDTGKVVEKYVLDSKDPRKLKSFLQKEAAKYAKMPKFNEKAAAKLRSMDANVYGKKYLPASKSSMAAALKLSRMAKAGTLQSKMAAIQSAARHSQAAAAAQRAAAARAASASRGAAAARAAAQRAAAARSAATAQMMAQRAAVDRGASTARLMAKKSAAAKSAAVAQAAAKQAAQAANVARKAVQPPTAARKLTENQQTQVAYLKAAKAFGWKGQVVI